MNDDERFDATDTRGPYVAAELDEAAREVERLRGLIRAVVARGWLCECDTFPAECWFCRADAEDYYQTQPDRDDDERWGEPKHKPECPWPALVAEAEKP